MGEEKRDRDNHEENYYKKLTIPNVLTVFRMISSVALCGYIATFGITSPLLITLATIGIGATDVIDGYLARNCGMSSQLGSILDPIADKIFNWGIGITLMATGIMPLWPLLISVRDISMFAVASYEFKTRGKELLPTVPAKLKMALQSAGLISTLAFGFGDHGLSLIAPICMGAAIATVVPEIYCIKKKYYSKKDKNKNNDFNESVMTLEQYPKEIEQKEKSKTLEYNNLTFEKTNDKQKIKKKTLFK